MRFYFSQKQTLEIVPKLFKSYSIYISKYVCHLYHLMNTISQATCQHAGVSSRLFSKHYPFPKIPS